MRPAGRPARHPRGAGWWRRRPACYGISTAGCRSPATESHGSPGTSQGAQLRTTCFLGAPTTGTDAEGTTSLSTQIQHRLPTLSMGERPATLVHDWGQSSAASRGGPCSQAPARSWGGPGRDPKRLLVPRSSPAEEAGDHRVGAPRGVLCLPLRG